VVQSVLNGREALEALACERFDVVLMDVQMPEINGLQAAAAIRQKEEHDGHHVPIIAMTAHALDGDRERCLAAGMDDYLTKPVKAEALSAALDRWAAPRRCPEQAEEADNRAPEELTRSRSPGEPPPSTPGKSNFSADVFDMTALRERVEDDLDLLAEIIGLSLESSPLLMSEIQSAVSAGDFDKSTRDAHTLKGALKNMCAGRCAEAAQEMETAGESKDAERAEQALAHLNDEFERLHSALTEVAGEVNA